MNMGVYGGFVRKITGLVIITILVTGAAMADEAADKKEERLAVIRYGTETEIAALIDSLKKDTDYSDDGLDAELAALAEKTRNRKILTGIWSFFGGRDKGGLEDKAIAVIENPEDENPDTVLAAMDYVQKVKAASAVPVLRTLITDGAENFRGRAIRALGVVSNGAAADETADFLIDLYENGNPGAGNDAALMEALGGAGSKKASPFLSDIVTDEANSSTLRIAALGALAKIADESALTAVLDALQAPEPTVRTAAIAALSSFSGAEVDAAILENFRDPVFRIRAAAAKAAGEKKLAAAVPYLKYRAEKDEARNVREESVRALGAIGNADALDALKTLLEGDKIAEYVRTLSAEILLKNNADAYAETVIGVMDAAQKAKRTGVYNGCLRALSTAKSNALEDLAQRFFAFGTSVEKTVALEITRNNNFFSLKEYVRALADPKNGVISTKAQEVLTALGG